MDRIAEEKNKLRRKYKQLRMEMPMPVRRQANNAITKFLLKWENFQKYDIILSYLSFGEEIETMPLLQEALRMGKQVAVPKTSREENKMTFYYVDKLDEALVPGTLGILEPDLERCEEWDGTSALCLVPGLCFDWRGQRIGYGKGYYDRFLSSFSGESVGLCYHTHVESIVPAEGQDQPVDWLVTERGILITKE